MKLRPDQIGKAIRLRKKEWVDSVMKKHLPPRIWRAMQHPATAETAIRWIKEQGYRVFYEEAGTVIVKKGDKTLAQCKVMLDLETPDDLLALAGAMRKE